MTLIKPEKRDGGAEKVLLCVEEHFNDAADVFRAAAGRLAAGEIVEPSKARDMVGEYRKLATLLYRERKSLEDERKKQAGVYRDYAIDFGEARDEIRRRMACLRSVGEGRDLSE